MCSTLPRPRGRPALSISALSLLLFLVTAGPLQAQPDRSDAATRSIEVRLQEGQAPGAFMSRIRQEYRNQLERVRPLFSVSPDALDALHERGRHRTGRAVPNLNRWVRVVLKDEDQMPAMIEALRGLDEVDMVEPAPIPEGPPAVTPSFVSSQGYLDPATDGIDAMFAWDVPGGTGVGVSVFDVEYCWNQTHEDLSSVWGVVQLASPGETPVCSYPPDHGTAVLGELIADNNAFGVTGIVYDAGIGLAPAETDAGYNPANAIALSAAAGNIGDVILIEQQTGVCNLNLPCDGPGGDCGPLEWMQSVFDAIVNATSAGLIVVEAAGNGGVDLDQDACDDKFDRGTRDSGAIIVGAGQPPASGNDRERHGFSSYGSRVDLQAWGGSVMTTGYGGYKDPDDPADQDRWYTAGFGGTSSASPIVTGAVVALQGIAKAIGDPLFTASQVRDLLLATGSPQLGDLSEHIGPRPNLAAAIITQFPALFPPEITSISPLDQDVQYSDEIVDITIQAEDIGSDVLILDRAGLPSDLTIEPATDAAACVPTDYGTACEWTVTGQMLEPAQSFTLTVRVTDSYGLTDESEYEIAVHPEDVVVTFDPDNPIGVQADSEGGDSEPFTLTTYVVEHDDPAATAPNLPGDITEAEVGMDLVALVGGGSFAGVCVPNGTSAGVTPGYDVLRVDCSFDDIPVNAYAVDVTVNGGYYAGSGEDVLVIFDPSLGFTTGGGWFTWPCTEQRVNFGFTFQYNGGSLKGKGKGVEDKEPRAQGSLLVIRHLGDGTSYRLKSNAIDAMALDPENGWATVIGKATYREPGWAEAVGDHDFMLYVEDNGTPGAETDRFWVQVRDPEDALVPALSMSDPMTTTARLLMGGNIVVPHEGGNGKNKTPPGQASKAGDEVAPVADELPDAFEVSGNYPNPFNPVTSIRVELPEESPVRLEVYDVTGRLVDRVVDRVLPAGVHTLNWNAGDRPTGMYFYRITAGPLAETRAMVLLR